MTIHVDGALPMRAQIMLCVLGLAATACMDDSESAPPISPGISEATVFTPGPRLTQCGPIEITRTQSAAKLTAGGIEVRSSSCGDTGRAYPAMCGAATGNLLLHDIPEASLEAAQALGYGSVDELGEDWGRASCPPELNAIEKAQASTSCADIRNRVFLIQEVAHPDERMYLIDQAGSCADASYRQVLLDEDGDDELCSNADSIAGPHKTCRVPARAALFDTILANLDQADLGLGTAYNVGLVYAGD